MLSLSVFIFSFSFMELVEMISSTQSEELKLSEVAQRWHQWGFKMHHTVWPRITQANSWFHFEFSLPDAGHVAETEVSKSLLIDLIFLNLFPIPEVRNKTHACIFLEWVIK